MRREIKGQVFDTEKDKLIYETWKNGSLSANYEFEILYKNATGAYYIYEGGGPKTRFAEKLGNIVTVGGSRIRYISDIDAEIWCLEKVLPYELLEREA